MKENMKENLEFRNLLARWGLGQNKLSSHTTVTDSYEKSFDTHFVSSGLLWQYLVTQSQPSLHQTVQLFFVCVFCSIILLMETLRRKLLWKRHAGKC